MAETGKCEACKKRGKLRTVPMRGGARHGELVKLCVDIEKCYERLNPGLSWRI